MDIEQGQLDELIRQIVAEVHPVRVILFGSAARGQLAPGSDLDLLIVMPDGTHRRHTAQHLYRSIHDVSLPVDLVVATVGDLEKYRDHVGLIYRTILQEGREVYAA